ncbi:type III protein arginine methyltransferase [Ranunculus cassubicifolius]
MLNDSPRNRAFRLAIEKTVTKPCHVLDIGQHSYSLVQVYTICVHLSPAGMETVIHVNPQQYPMHCDAITEDIKLLSEPFQIFEFDFWKRPDSHGEAKLHIRSTAEGRVHAVVSWWVLQLDYEGTIFYSTAPRWISSPYNTKELQPHFDGDAVWCDHWKQCIWFAPGRGISVSKDDQVHLQAVHDDTSIQYTLDFDKHRKEPVQFDLNSSSSQLSLSPERIALYGDREWRYTMFTAIRDTLQQKDCRVCVVADDSVFLTVLIAHLSTSSRIISLFPGLKEKGDRYLRSVARANGFSTERVKVLGKKGTCLTMDDVNHEKVDLLVGEPFYYGNEGMLPWQNLRFWKERTMLDSVLSEDVVIMPYKGLLKACAMSLPDLWRSRHCLAHVEGFDHTTVNSTLGACGNEEDCESPCIPYFVWQCGETKELSAISTVMEFDFTKPIYSCFGKAKIEFTSGGMCHGFALWIDWVLDERSSIVISNGPDCRYHKQGVKLLSKPVAVGLNGVCNSSEYGSTEVEAYFDPSNGELTVKTNF